MLKTAPACRSLSSDLLRPGSCQRECFSGSGWFGCSGCSGWLARVAVAPVRPSDAKVPVPVGPALALPVLKCLLPTNAWYSHAAISRGRRLKRN